MPLCCQVLFDGTEAQVVQALIEEVEDDEVSTKDGLAKIQVEIERFTALAEKARQWTPNFVYFPMFQVHSHGQPQPHAPLCSAPLCSALFPPAFEPDPSPIILDADPLTAGELNP